MRHYLACFLSALMLAACATGPDVRDDAAISDPFEPLNRKVYAFNESVDKAVIGPVARTYEKTVPEPGRIGLRNAIANSNAPVTFANDLLQGKPQRAAETLSRFIINTTIGLGGFIDVAGSGSSGIEGHTEDFGQTMAVWGVPEGVYFVTPILGPSNLRDSTGRIVDTALDPLTWVEFGLSNLDFGIQTGRTIASAVDTRAQLDGAIQDLRAQPEPYTALRRAYASQRHSAIRDGVIADDAYDDLPDFDDFDEDFEDDFSELDDSDAEEIAAD